jgi:anti-anti-sigma regulatory factor
VLISETVTGDGEMVWFSLEGDFELTDVEEVERRVADRRPGDRAVLDTRGLRFLDSSALALLLRLQRLADEGAWHVSYVPGEALLARARRTGLDTILHFAEAPDPAAEAERERAREA